MSEQLADALREKVAAAIAVASDDNAFSDTFDPRDPDEEGREEDREYYRRLADAALLALRDPTELSSLPSSVISDSPN